MNEANHGPMVPRDKDVLFGRGGAIACHPGNLRLRALVRRHKPRFDRSKNMRKRTVAMAIVDQIERGGGRFLAEDPDAVAAKAASIGERRWVEVDREKSEEKVMHRLREKDKGGNCDDPQLEMRGGGNYLGNAAGNPFPGGPPSGIDAVAGGLAPSQQRMQDGPWGDMNGQQQFMGNQQFINSQPALDANELQQLQTQWQSGMPTGNNPVMNGLGGMEAQEQSQRDMLAGMSSLLHQFGDANLSGSSGSMGMQMQQSMAIALPSSNGPSPDLGGQLQNPVQPVMASPQTNGLVNGSNQQALDFNQLQQSMENHSLCDGLARQLPLDAKLQNLGAQTSWSDDTSILGGFGSQSNTAGHTMNDSMGMQQQEQTVGNGFNPQLSLDANQLQSGTWMGSADVAQSTHTMNNNSTGIGMLHQGSIFSSGFGAAPIGIGEWMQTTREVLSKNAYIVGAVELGWAIAKNLNDLIECGKAVSPGEIVSKNILIFMESSDPASYAVPPAIREVQLQARDPDGGAHQTRAGSSREVCASLGQILLDLFSMNQSSSMDFSSQRTQENTGNQQVQKRQATTASTRGSISSKANNLLVGLAMPTSINRLVCDLLDSVNEACPSTALMTLEELLEDLSQMRSDPDLFLFDRTNPEEAMDHFYSLDENLFGREKELAALMKAKDDVSTSVLGDGRVGQGNDFVCEAAFVGGYAGSGKSSLLLPLVSAYNEEQWFVLCCKFVKQTAPVKVLYSALDDFFGKLGEGSDSNFNPALMGSFQEVCECICSTIDDDGFHQLSELVPNFTKMYPHLVKRTSTPEQAVVSSMDKVGSAKRRLQNLIHVLFKSLCSAGRPILLVLDDLQWCDSFVLEGLTEFIVSYIHSEAGASNNGRRRGLMLAGTYRSNEVTDSHPFIESINCLKNSQKANVTMLTAGELSKADVTMLISSKLCLPWRYTRELANVVHSKTRGNPFFVIQFLRSIVSNKMLEFSVKARRWVWDCDVVEMQMISDGVAGLLAASFNQLPSQLTETMKIVSCLGYQVERSTIDALGMPYPKISWA